MNIPISYKVRPLTKHLENGTVDSLFSMLILGNPAYWQLYPWEDSMDVSHPWARLNDGLSSNRWFASAEPRATPAEQGIHLDVSGTCREGSTAAGFFAALSVYTLAILPYYSETATLVVQYDLYSGSRLQKRYEYEIRKKGMGTVLALPFAWINLITGDLEDAVVVTAEQFLSDARRDGYLESARSSEGDPPGLAASGAAERSPGSPAQRATHWPCRTRVP